MARKPIGEWEPKTNEEMETATAFGKNEALQNEVERDTAQWLGGIEEQQAYEIDGTAFELEPKVLKGLADAKPENKS